MQFVTGVLATYLKNQWIKRLCSAEKDPDSVNDENQNCKHNQQLKEDIRNEEVFACVDVSVKGRYVGA